MPSECNETHMTMSDENISHPIEKEESNAVPTQFKLTEQLSEFKKKPKLTNVSSVLLIMAKVAWFGLARC